MVKSALNGCRTKKKGLLLSSKMVGVRKGSVESPIKSVDRSLFFLSNYFKFVVVSFDQSLPSRNGMGVNRSRSWEKIKISKQESRQLYAPGLSVRVTDYPGAGIFWRSRKISARA
ncbi:MAG: hypothetical protein AAGE99_02630 [Chlamydiota bacterium]